MNVEIRRRLAARDDLRNTGYAGEQAGGLGTRSNDHPGAAFGDERGVADELYRVAQPLLDVQQYALAGDVAALPLRPRRLKLAVAQPLGFPAPFVLAEAFLQVSQQQPGQRQVPMRFRVVRLRLDRRAYALLAVLYLAHGDEQRAQGNVSLGVTRPYAQRFAVAALRFLQISLLARQGAEAHPGFRVAGIDAQRVAKPGHGEIRPIPGDPGEREVVAGLGIVGLQAQGLPIARRGLLVLPQVLVHVSEIRVIRGHLAVALYRPG